MAGVFCGGIRGEVWGMCRVSACVGCEMMVFVGFGGLVGRGNLEQNRQFSGQFSGKIVL